VPDLVCGYLLASQRLQVLRDWQKLTDCQNVFVSVIGNRIPCRELFVRVGASDSSGTASRV
jgi:hypothetical protein